MNTSQPHPTPPPNTGDTDIDEILHSIYLGDDEHDKKVYLDETYTGYKEAKAAITKKQQEIEKAYGSCRKCYGKGYATVITSESWSDTDTDIGSPGGSGHSDNLTIKYCTCERGKQLEALQATKEKLG